jgi:hypothetical protein
MGFLAIGAGDGIALGADGQGYRAHGALIFQLGQHVIKFAKRFRNLLAQLLMTVHQPNHVWRSASGCGAGMGGAILDSLDPLHGSLDALDRMFDTLGTHGKRDTKIGLSAQRLEAVC